MNATARQYETTRKRAPIGRIILLAIGLFLIVEPIVMYRALVRQRDQRQAARELMMQVPTGDSGR
jgi:hypothetical protein